MARKPTPKQGTRPITEEQPKRFEQTKEREADGRISPILLQVRSEDAPERERPNSDPSQEGTVETRRVRPDY